MIVDFLGGWSCIQCWIASKVSACVIFCVHVCISDDERGNVFHNLDTFVLCAHVPTPLDAFYFTCEEKGFYDYQICGCMFY